MALPAGTTVVNGFALTPDGALYVTSTGGTVSSPLLAPDGSAGAPSYSWAGDATEGFYRSGSSIGVAIGGALTAAFSANTFNVNGASGVVSINNDVVIARDAANTFALKNGNSAQESRIYAGNGGFLSNVVSVNESLTIAAAATTDSALTVPAGAILLAASVRVTTTIPTAATFTVTTATGGTALNTAAVNVAAGSTDPGTAAGASYRSASTKIRITPSLTPGTATGVVRLCVYYLNVTPPTS